MTVEPGAPGAPRPSTDERAQGQDVLGLGERERDALFAWVGENLTLVRRSASGQRILYWSLGIGFVVGLAAHVGGFLLKTSTTTEPLLLVGDLLYTLGWALWTGAVVVVFTQIYPEAKRRQFKQALDAYEAAAGDQARAGSDQVPLGEQDEEDQAARWYRKAASAGDAAAMVNLGALLRKQGKEDQAGQWYRKAADAGNADAMVNLGALLAEQGEEDQAEQWYRKAADAGRRDG
jgi:tetratricopeptide (TPR) repeat protein